MNGRLIVNHGLILGLAVVAAVSSRAVAEPLPVVVVTLAPVDALMEKVEYLAQVTGFADSPQVRMVQGAINGFTQGLDRQRPLAILVQADEDSFQAFAMLPIVDLDQWLQTLPAMGSPVADLGNGTYQVQLGPQALVLTADEGWAYLSRSADALPLRPTDPLDVLEGLDAQYELAIRFIVQNIPEGPREFALNQYRQLMQMAISRADESGSPQAQFQRANMERQFAEIQRFADEADLITLGLRVTPSQEAIVGEFSMTAIPGSRTDRRMAVADKAQTNLSGFFFPQATVTASMSHSILPEDVADQTEQLQAVLELAKTVVAGDDFPGSATAKQELTVVVDEIGEITQQTLAAGVVDAAMTLATTSQQLNVIAATRMAGGDRWEEILTRLQTIAEEMDIPADFRLRFTEQDGVRFHAAQFALPDSKELSRAFGEKLTVYFGVSDDTLYVGVGQKSLAGLRKAITASSGSPQPVPPLRGLVSVGEIVNYVAHVVDRDEAQAVADAFAKASEKDQIRISQQLDRGGRFVTRLEIQDGVLASLGRVIQDQLESR